MCPDRRLLSVHLDGELPSPWREKLEAHLEQCSDCRKTLEAYHKLSVSAAPDHIPDGVMEEAKERVWLKLSNTPEAPRSLWRKPLILPLPLAAAAALMIVALGALAIGLRPKTNDQMVAEIAYDQGEAIPLSNINEVIRYLESQDSQNEIVIIRLPDSQYFNLSGEPSLIRAADYTGRLTR